MDSYYGECFIKIYYEVVTIHILIKRVIDHVDRGNF